MTGRKAPRRCLGGGWRGAENEDRCNLTAKPNAGNGPPGVRIGSGTWALDGPGPDVAREPARVRP